MWISRRTDYATRALLALTLAEGELLSVEEIARRTAVPASVLEQVMPALRSAGLVRSEHGRAGGYRLNKAPEAISMERVVRLFQGQLAPIGCATRRDPEPCAMLPGCSLQETWQEVRDATIAILSRTTFADLAERARGPWLEHRPVIAPSQSG
jgi:Rrf2 family protein